MKVIESQLLHKDMRRTTPFLVERVDDSATAHQAAYVQPEEGTPNAWHC